MSQTEKVKKGQIVFNKWMFKLGFVPLYQATNLYVIHFGIFKITSRPPEGDILTTKNYQGFWWRKQFFIRGFEINI